MASDIKYDDVQVMLADPRTHIRSTLKVALSHAGLENIEHTGNLDGVTDSIEHSIGPDILICDMGLGDGEIIDVVSSVRHNDRGKNPFLCVIGISWEAEAQDVIRMINCGIDHLVTAPLSPQQILSRVSSMVNHRLPFVVTADYVGPDRRKLTRPGKDYPIVDVPNSLKDKALGIWDLRRFEQNLATAVGSINTRKIDRQAEIIAALADSITELANEPDGLARIHPQVERLTLLVGEMDRRAGENGIHHVAELCRACVGVVTEMRIGNATPSEQDLEVLKHLGMAIRASLYPTELNKDLAGDIIKTVARR
ncbi:MAG: response regulator [Alphaproteobacteria bacterium]|nr:response regulator [Alphaproteobacteria bacterium]